MHELDCTDETFDLNFTSEYKLSIQLGLDGFSFCVIDNIRKKYLVLKHFPFSLSNDEFLFRKIKEIMDDEEILNRLYKNTIISFVSRKFTAVPSGLKADINDIYNLNFPPAPDEITGSFNTSSFNAKIIYASPRKLCEFLTTRFENPVFIHQVKPLIKLASKNSEKGQVSALISVTKSFYILIVSQGDKLIFLNSFRYSNNMDFIYYLLNATGSLEINPDDMRIKLVGEIREDSHLVEFIKERFGKVEFGKLAKGYQYSYTFAKFPAHMFVSVINP